jgi:hypothetical protein
MTIRPLLFVLSVLMISSCDKNIDIPIPEESNKVVVNMLMNKDSIMIARVSISGRLSNLQDMPEVANAAMNLYENGTLKGPLTPYVLAGRTFYRSNTLPQAGATYRVTAAVPGYTEVSGSDQIPDTVKIGEMKMTVAQVDNMVSKVTISVQLHDDAAVQNYYRVRIYQVNEWVNANGTRGQQKMQQYFETDDTEWELFGEKSRPEFYTTDALFNGRSPRFTFRVNTGNKFKKMIVEITSLTYSSYNYLNSTFLAREKNEDGLSEKVIVYNNIENGLGIVGGVAQREYDLVR